VPDEISAFSGREEAERDSDQVADVVKCSGPRRAYERFQFSKGQFDRIEIRTVGRQEAEVGTDGFESPRARRVVCGRQGCRAPPHRPAEASESGFD
jgi:hypothetical protein